MGGAIPVHDVLTRHNRNIGMAHDVVEDILEILDPVRRPVRYMCRLMDMTRAEFSLS